MAANLQLQGYFPTAGAAPVAPAPVALPSAPRPTLGKDVSVLGTISPNGPILPTTVPAAIGAVTRAYPAGLMAAVGSAQAIASHSNGTMVKGVGTIVDRVGEPLLNLSWGLVSNLANFLGHLLTFQFGSAVNDFAQIFSSGAINTGKIVRGAFEPLSLTAAVSGGSRLNPASALGAGLSMGLRAIKSSFVWAIPSAAINAFIDYKYKDVTDTKRIFTNFAADVVGYTGAGMAGAAAGAFVGSMTMPIVGTIVGAGVGILLGMLHEKTTRPLISDALRDSLG